MASAEQANTQGFTLPPILDGYNRLDSRQKLTGMVGVALMIALIVGGVLWTREPTYAVLFSNIAEKDGGQIVAVLQQQNVPYKFSETGNAILVPGNVVHDIRLRLASQGLPRGGLVGFELMENQKLGASQFSEQINYQRGLEGELARSIQSLGAVRGARVHLAIPKQTGFLRDEQKPSASVLLALNAGRVLEPSQVAGIIHLVASSVPQLNPLNVSVIDQDGNLISQQKTTGADSGLDASQLKYVRELEASYIKRIEAIVGTVVGSGNVRAQVAADVDFSQGEQVAETYKPNPVPETAIRSQQTAETGTTQPPAAGVPGALTNQPPVPATAPITSPSVAPVTNTNNASAPVNFSKNATINYEVDKTIRHTKVVPGTIRRLSVAVVVNNKQEVGKDGKPKPAPLTEAEIKQITDLARESMGFNKERGDSLNVANASFSPQEKEVIPDQPIWKDASNIALFKDLLKYLVIGVIAFILWRKILKPLLDRIEAVNRRAEEAAAAEAAANDIVEFGADGAHETTSANANFERKLAEAKEVAKQDPKMVANVIKEWVSGSEPR